MASGSKELSQSIKAKASKLLEKNPAARACQETPQTQTHAASSAAVSASTKG
jgi:hypothetical protein